MADRTLQRLIFVGCRELGIDDETRRDLQVAMTGKASLSEMSDVEMRAVLDGLKARGFRPETSAATGRKRPAAPRPDLRYIHVLWALLAKRGALSQPGRRGLNAFVRERFQSKWGAVPLDIDMLTDAGQIADVTTALKAMCKRVGIPTER